MERDSDRSDNVARPDHSRGLLMLLGALLIVLLFWQIKPWPKMRKARSSCSGLRLRPWCTSPA